MKMVPHELQKGRTACLRSLTSTNIITYSHTEKWYAPQVLSVLKGDSMTLLLALAKHIDNTIQTTFWVINYIQQKGF